ncbi:hypothetical protein VTN31DRAFT_5476 [Thermomyces dupontii]|uniref:uncharacterized protein n=1 Tax=Talaromyces thermophilus TaxID=28565 RepID=UPI0037433AF1
MAARRHHLPRRKYHWPDIQLNIWLIIVLAGSGACLGMYAWLMTVQTQLDLGIPWLFPFMVATSSLGVAFVVLILILAARHFLLPGIIMLGSFVLFVLWLTGLVESALQMYGAKADVNADCQNFVSNMPYRGNTVEALAWLTQNNICNCWKATFAFEVVNTAFYLWMMIMSWQVHRDAL